MKEDIRTQNTKNKLCQTLLQLLSYQDFDKLSVIDICRASGIHRATFYRHFEDKYNLLTYSLRQLKEKIISLTNQYIMNVRDVKKIYLIIADKTLEVLREHSKSIISVIKSNKSEGFFSLIKDYFESIFSQQIINATHKTSIEQRMISNFYIGGFLSLAIWWIQNLDKCDKEQVLSALDKFLENINI